MTNKTWNKWTQQEDELLRYHWENSIMEILMKTFPNRTYNSLMCRAQKLGIKSAIKRKRKGSLDFLNNLNLLSYYWWGFIMADGHISHKGELVITLSKIDKDHLLRLAKHLERDIQERGNFCILRIQDSRFGKKWLNDLKIVGPKTYFPPDLTIFLNKDALLSFFIGMIDGDGCIWETKGWLNSRIELHGSWLATLQLISSKLKEFYDIDCKVKMTKRGTSRLEINTKKDLKILKDYIKNVEYLERKWSKLDTL